MTDLISKDIIDLQDIEKVQFLQSLQADPAKYSQYVQGKRESIQRELLDSKRAAFTKTSGDMARMMDMDHNSMATMVRSGQLKESQDHIYTEQERVTRIKKANEDLTRRQVEINDWYYENKRETLFVLQLILLTALTVVILLYLKTNQWIGEKVSDYILFFVLLTAGCTWLGRWYYTTYIRDRRYWNNRTFEKGTIPDPTPKCDSGSA
jgi:DNA-binding transcriptional regulator of glucitol operon